MPLSKIVAKSITDDTITTDQIADTSVHGRRNLIINGAMQVAQRGTSSTSTGYQTIDRYKIGFAQVSVTTSQQSLTSGDPYNDGFRNFIRLANTSVSSATDAYAQIAQIIEAQDIANSGWQYASSDSSITLSFWARSSLAGTYYAQFTTFDTGEYLRDLSFTLAANTWKKISVTAAGNSNLVFNNDNGQGLLVMIVPHYGTTYTGGGEVSTTDWFSRASQTDAYFPDYAQNWSNTASSTFDVTGLQLEVGDKATPFEHRSFGEELNLCQRYHYRRDITIYDVAAMGNVLSTNRGAFLLHLPTAMRAKPSVSQGSNIVAWYTTGGSVAGMNNLTTIYMDNDATDFNQVYIMADANSTVASVSYPLALTSYHGSGTADSHVSLDAEL